MQKLILRLQEKFNISDIDYKKEGLTFAVIEDKHLVSFLTHLRDIENFTHLSFLTAVDRIEEQKFQLTYMLHNYGSKNSLGVKVYIDRRNAEMESIHHLWQQAATYQRELHEMFGIKFPKSPRNDESFILEGWHDKPPMRRDFKTKQYSEETYFPRPGRKSYDPETYMREKLYSEGDE
ncbi:MAG TPA: NADH-quinone oxidoreductase subunit C [bacterium]|nr:NADH-quinone oxidoreductase subunit C [bacterium]